MKKLISVVLWLMALTGVLALLVSISNTSVISAVGNVEEIVTEITEYIF